ncbi:hypothetical protein ACQY0O_002163 [Thecaphora frezii]
MGSAPQSSQPAAEVRLGEALVNLLDKEVKVKASSGSSKDAKGILNGDLETAWSSENTSPTQDATTCVSTLTFKLPSERAGLKLSSLHSIALTFAGGFSATQAKLLYATPDDAKQWKQASNLLYPHDSNAKQFFRLDTPQDARDNEIASLQLELQGSTDDYGRVTVYQVEVYAIVPM